MTYLTTDQDGVLKIWQPLIDATQVILPTSYLDNHRLQRQQNMSWHPITMISLRLMPEVVWLYTRNADECNHWLRSTLSITLRWKDNTPSSRLQKMLCVAITKLVEYVQLSYASKADGKTECVVDCWSAQLLIGRRFSNRCKGDDITCSVIVKTEVGPGRVDLSHTKRHCFALLFLLGMGMSSRQKLIDLAIAITP